MQCCIPENCAKLLTYVVINDSLTQERACIWQAFAMVVIMFAILPFVGEFGNQIFPVLLATAIQNRTNIRLFGMASVNLGNMNWVTSKLLRTICMQITWFIKLHFFSAFYERIYQVIEIVPWLNSNTLRRNNCVISVW